MILLKDVKDWLKTLEVGEHFYMGKLDAKQKKSIGVYQRKNSYEPRICIGGYDLASYEVKPISILVHWNLDADETEQAAWELFEAINNSNNVTINNVQIPFIRLLNAEPIDVGTDDNGVYERVIELDMYYKKGE